MAGSTRRLEDGHHVEHGVVKPKPKLPTNARLNKVDGLNPIPRLANPIPQADGKHQAAALKTTPDAQQQTAGQHPHAQRQLQPRQFSAPPPKCFVTKIGMSAPIGPAIRLTPIASNVIQNNAGHCQM